MISPTSFAETGQPELSCCAVGTAAVWESAGTEDPEAACDVESGEDEPPHPAAKAAVAISGTTNPATPRLTLTRRS